MCIDEALVSRAVGDNGGNATLLVEAFSAMCPHPVADHPAFVVFSYFFGFLPWGILVLIDFISSKWKSIRDTRSSGYMQLIFLLFPMAIVVAYAVIQGISGDYKEMMTAIAAVFLTLYHVGRTAMGLAQLRDYQAWCVDTLKCIRSARFPDDRKEIEQDDEVFADSLLVNNSLVDNELHGSGIPVEFDWFSGRLTISCPKVLSVRWTGAFLCAQGHEWGLGSFSRSTKVSLSSRVIWHLSYTTSRIMCLNGAFSEFCVRELWDKWRSVGVCSGAFGSSISPFTPNSVYSPDVAVTQHQPGSRVRSLPNLGTSLYPTLSSFENELDNIVCSYPNEIIKDILRRTVDMNRHGTSLDQVELTMIVKSIGSDSIACISAECARMQFAKPEVAIGAWDLFCTQIGASEEDKNATLHQFWKLFVVPLWLEKKNEGVLQASAHVDIEVALKLGDHFFEVEETKESEHGDMFERSKARVVFMEGHLVSNPSCFFLGVGLEAVRSFLQEWRLGIGCAPAFLPDWSPPVPNDMFSFLVSDFVCDFSYCRCSNSAEQYLKARIVWECQLALHARITDFFANHFNLPSSAHLIMFFMCSFPQIVVFWNVEHDSADGIQSRNDSTVGIQHVRRVNFELEPINCPQKFKVLITLHIPSRTAEMKIDTRNETGGNTGNAGMEFKWEDWIDAAMGLKTGWDLRLEKSTGRRMDGLQSCSVDLYCPLKTIQPPELLEQIRVWHGWPVFNSRICQFEREQWTAAGGTFAGFKSDIVE